MVEEKKNEKILTDVLYQTGNYYYLTSDNNKAIDYFDRALPIYQKLNHPVGQGYVYLCRGDIYFRARDNSKALEVYDKTLFFLREQELLIQGFLLYRIKQRF